MGRRHALHDGHVIEEYVEGVWIPVVTFTNLDADGTLMPDRGVAIGAAKVGTSASTPDHGWHRRLRRFLWGK